MLDDLEHFVAIVQAGNLSRAAKQRHIPTATLTRRLQKLESRLGCRLLHRGPRGIRLTQEGEAYYARCQPLLAHLTQTVQDIRHDTTEPSGEVRVLAPANMAVTVLADFWADFLRRYPHIQLDLRLDNHNDDLLQQGADLALRVGEQQHPNYQQRHLSQVPMGIFAAPNYLANHVITSPDDLAQQAWLIATPLTQFTLQKGEDSQKIHLQNNCLQVNEIRLCVKLAARGLGLCYVPKTLCRAELADGRLRAVLPDWQAPQRDIYAVWQAQKQLPARVRVLVDALVAFMKNERTGASV